MEQPLNHFNAAKNSVVLGAIGLCGALWISHLGNTFLDSLFDMAIWLVLVYGGWVDWKTQRIHDAVPLCAGVLGGLYCIITHQPLVHWGMGLVVNSIVLGMLYVASRKSIGLGDVKLLIALGIYLGPLMSFSLLFHASWMGAIAALAGVAAKKFKMRQVLPFAPFIAAGFLLAISSL